MRKEYIIAAVAVVALVVIFLFWYSTTPMFKLAAIKAAQASMGVVPK